MVASGPHSGIGEAIFAIHWRMVGSLTPTALAAAAIEYLCSVTRRTASRLKSSVYVLGRARRGESLLAIYRSSEGHYAAFPAVRK
jgi:hypothetical protein